ncbi:hypothetical protein [Nonomuraea guangzhouensis]|uniref:Uncharacterized protein n=1 Tax=Nonomuraea guangzhouensis TaxID=1291555 RepID=A0ABW4GYI1_9ACTN|nr:hypothetical protein [Nonomuraea guangzhouensis]
MSETKTDEIPQITFIGYRRPALKSGAYHIAVEQKVIIGSTSDTFAATGDFTIAGERFTLAPSAVKQVFPPDGSLGEHSTALPHIVLNRPTLPWERDPGGPGSQPPPWLALLVFSDDERPQPTVVTLADLPAVQRESHQSPTDPVTVIDVPKALLADLLPAYDDLRYLAHVRSGDGPDTAVVVAARLPAPGVSTTVHLVSLEGRFHVPEGARTPVFDYGQAAAVRLVTLASWRFACVDDAYTFGRMAGRLAEDPGDFRLPSTAESPGGEFLREGFVPARHRMRHGARSIAWYRGPLTTGPVDQGPVEPVHTADALLRFHPEIGMFDVGYAAAWQLGRLLTLRSPDTAATLYQWRRRRDRNLKRAAREPDGYPLAVVEIDDTVPESALDWLGELSRLQGVPLGYLIPDERLLPVETIRFFGLDQQWVRYLVDGAWSIGRLTAADADLDASYPLELRYPRTTGALIRSDLVSGYPGLLIDAYADAQGQSRLPLLRSERLTPNILLCLFEGVLARLDLHQAPESQHFAVGLSDGRTFTRTLRGSGGTPVTLPLGPRRTLPVGDLVSAMASQLRINRPDFTSGNLAQQMIETAERITFLR